MHSIKEGHEHINMNPPLWQPTSIEMGPSIEPKTHNRGEEQKGKTAKYRRGKKKGDKNFIPQTTTLSIIITKP
jgi:hypothetical protein